jgi:hypothetical protein
MLSQAFQRFKFINKFVVRDKTKTNQAAQFNTFIILHPADPNLNETTTLTLAKNNILMLCIFNHKTNPVLQSQTLL